MAVRHGHMGRDERGEGAGSGDVRETWPTKCKTTC